jgi:hypothetical protein
MRCRQSIRKSLAGIGGAITLMTTGAEVPYIGTIPYMEWNPGVSGNLCQSSCIAQLFGCVTVVTTGNV